MDNDYVKNEFKKRVKMRNLGTYISIIPAILTIILVQIPNLKDTSSAIVLLILTFLSLIIGVAIITKYWRCPVCKHELPRGSSKNINNCYHCGAEFQ